MSRLLRPFAPFALALAACGVRAPSPPSSPGGPGPAAVRVLPGGLDGRAWLAPDAARAITEGAGPLEVLGADVLSEGDRLGGFVEIPDGDCLLALSRASPTIGDVDLFAYEDDGSVFASDESPDSQAALLVCPPHPRRLYVVGRVMSGAGILSLGVQKVPPAAADAVAKATGARGRPGDETGRFDSWPGLEAKNHAHRAALGARWEDVRRLAVPVGPRAPTRLSASVEAGRCTDVFIVPSEEVASLEVLAEDPGGRILGRAREHGRERSLLFCAASPAEVSISIRPRASQGLVAVTVGRSAAGAEVEIAEGSRPIHVTQSLELDAARRELGQALARAQGDPPSKPAYDAPKSIATGSARVGIRGSFAVDLPAGCARLDAIAGKPLADLAATLWDDHGALLAEARAGAVASLFPCGPGGAAHLDVEALGSPGPFAIELRRDHAAPPLLLGHPIAAARLLGRINAGAPPEGAEAAAAAILVSLDVASLRSVPLHPAAGQCVEVIAALDALDALDGRAGGLDLRLVDGTTREGAVTRARYVVSDRFCAGTSDRGGVAELRLLAGKGEALLLLRTAVGGR